MSNLVIKKMIVQGPTYQRTLEFQSGLNIIRGDRSTGKSLVLSLIDYVFGKDTPINLTVQKELDKYCEKVFLEISIKNEIFTISRNLKKQTKNFYLYYTEFESIDEFSVKKLNRKDYFKFLMKELNIKEYKKEKHMKHSEKKTFETISFRDVFRYCYISQDDLGTKYFMANQDKNKRYKNKFVFEMLFELLDLNGNELRERKVELENEVILEKKRKGHLEGYLDDRDASDYSLLLNKIDKINISIENNRIERNGLIQNSKDNQNKENLMYNKLKKQLINISNELSNIKKEKNELFLSVTGKTLLMKDYEKELIDIEATLEINHHIKKSEREIICPLCSSNVKNKVADQEKISDNEYQKVQKDLLSKIKLVNILIKNDQNKIMDKDKEMLGLEEEKKILENAISEYAKYTEVPFLSQLNSLNELSKKMIQKKERITDYLRVHKTINEKNKDIEHLNAQISELEKKDNQSEAIKRNKEVALEKINNFYVKNMDRLKYNESEGTFVDNENYVPFYEGADVFSQDSGGLRECMQISYFSSIIESDDIINRHPNLLLLDSISKYFGTNKNEGQEQGATEIIIPESEKITDPEVYEEVYNLLVDISKKSQIIIVENTPLNKFNKYFRYTFTKNGNGFVDLKKNEIESL